MRLPLVTAKVSEGLGRDVVGCWSVCESAVALVDALGSESRDDENDNCNGNVDAVDEGWEMCVMGLE